MNRNVGRAVVILGAFGCLMVAAAASAEETMAMPTPGAEVKAIAPLFGMNVTWKGTMQAGAMGPDSKEAPTRGKAMCKAILGGMWYACDVEEVVGTGKEAMTWKGHMMVGWDANAKSYKAVTVDNMGSIAMMDGHMDGAKFVLETPNEVMNMGQMMKDRLTWDMTDPKAIKFTDEHQMSGGDWKLAEAGTVTRMAGGAKPMAAAAEK